MRNNFLVFNRTGDLSWYGALSAQSNTLSLNSGYSDNMYNYFGLKESKKEETKDYCWWDLVYGLTSPTESVTQTLYPLISQNIPGSYSSERVDKVPGNAKINENFINSGHESSIILGSNASFGRNNVIDRYHQDVTSGCFMSTTSTKAMKIGHNSRIQAGIENPSLTLEGFTTKQPILPKPFENRWANFSPSCDEDVGMFLKAVSAVNPSMDELSVSARGGDSNSIIKFSMRRDVVKKTIFRSFKKYYIETFKSHYNFTKRVRRKNYNPSQLVFKEAEKYITKNMGTTKSSKLAMFLVAIIDTKQKFEHTDPVFRQVRSDMMGMLKHFNWEKLLKLLKFHEFSLLLGKFLLQPFDEISRNKEDVEVREIYMEQISWLKEQIHSFSEC